MQISIIEFSVENFLVFQKKVTFSMVTRKNEKHTFESNGENILKTSFIYGPNASGKTSLLRAFDNFRQGVLFSVNNTDDNDLSLPHESFKGFMGNDSKPVVFELTFSASGSNEGVYCYGFSFLSDRVVKENLVKISPAGRKEILFSRENQNITIKKAFEEAKVLIKRTREKTLFLSVCAQFNIDLAVEIVDAFKNLNIISGIKYNTYQGFTIKKFRDDPDYRKRMLRYLRLADFCISNGRTEEVDVNTVGIKDDQEGFFTTTRVKKANVLFLEHPIYNKNKEKIGVFELPLEEESKGTQKFLSILGPVIDTLDEGKVLFIDEFDNSLHPLLTKFIVDLFESSKSNRNNAQLIVTTHDTSLLSYKDEFIRDQFWFTDKDELGSAQLFSLAEFSLRNDTEFAKKYLEGRFGALPIIGPVHE